VKFLAKHTEHAKKSLRLCERITVYAALAAAAGAMYSKLGPSIPPFGALGDVESIAHLPIWDVHQPDSLVLQVIHAADAL